MSYLVRHCERVVAVFVDKELAEDIFSHDMYTIEEIPTEDIHEYI